MKGPDMTDTLVVMERQNLIARIEYILDPSASAKERTHRRSHLTNHDLRMCIEALSRPPVAGDGGEAERIATVMRCAKVVRELGPSGSPGATAAAMERNASVLAREAKPEEIAAVLAPPTPEPAEVTEEDEALANEITDAANIVSHDGYYELDTDAVAAVLAKHRLKFSTARRDEDVERVARAIYETEDQPATYWQQRYRRYARAALAALGEQQ